MKSRKTTFALLLFSFLSLWGNAQTASKFTIQLDGYDAAKHRHFATLELPHLTHPQKVFGRFTDAGQLDLTIVHNTLCECVFRYDYHVFSFFVAPNDSVVLRLPIDSLMDFEASLLAAELIGKRSETNRLMMKHQRTFKNACERDGVYVGC